MDDKARSAELHSAVSQNCILRGVPQSEHAGTCRRPADWKSTIQQIENLRYGSPVDLSSISRSAQHVNGTKGNQGNEERQPTGGSCLRSSGVWAVLLAVALHSTTAAAPLEWRKAQGHREARLAVPENGKTGFSSLAPSTTGIRFLNQLSEARVADNRVLDNGSGVALGDVDGDGLCDIYFCGLENANTLYRNLGGWKFEDITAKAGVACPSDLSTGAVLADLDGDGDLDLLVNSIGGGTRCFLNDGKARFTELTASGLSRKFGSTSQALADVDGDGDLDLYVANYRTDTYRDSPPYLKIQYEVADGKVIIRPEDRFYGMMKGKDGFMLIERGEADFLYLNDGRGKFTPVSWTGGAFRDEDGRPLAVAPQYWGLSAMFRDINGDGAPDLYVCNDFRFSPDQIWINDGQGRFQALPRFALRNMSMSSMGIDFADINRDGHVDFFVADMLSRDHKRRHMQRVNVLPDLMALPFGAIDNRPEVMRNTLYLNRGDTTFAEIAQFSGLQASEWSWCPIFLDVDLDGYEDLLISTGNGHDVIDSDGSARLEELTRRNPGKSLKALPQFPPLLTPSFAFRNRGDLTFEDVSKAWGFDPIGVSHGMALADLDNDGDFDVVVNNLNAPAGIYRNETSAPRLAVRLKGAAPNTRGIGAAIKVSGGSILQSQEMTSGGRYLSGDDSIRIFAAGALTNDLRVEVTWRSGRRSVVTNATPNFIYEIDEASAGVAPPFQSAGPGGFPAARVSGQESPENRQAGKPAPQSEGLFQDVSHLLNHVHPEEPFDDFARQPLLPNRLSQLGPGVCWQDVDSDGFDDLVIGSGKGGSLIVFRNQGDGKFASLGEPTVSRPVARDQTAIVGFGSNLLVGSANYEDGLTNGGWIRIYDLNRKAAGDSILGPSSSTGPLALADVDADGNLDLFIGGRVIAGRYPEPATSMLLKNEAGRFVVSQRWERLGLVSGAAFSDLDGDGSPELLLACEWGPILLFRNDKGRLAEWNPMLRWHDSTPLNSQLQTLNSLTGWWNGVTTGDFDGDGRMDIIASNWGRNTKYELFRRDSLRVHFGDFNGTGAVDVLEAYLDRATQRVVPWRGFDIIGGVLPFVRERFATFNAYAAASLSDIGGESLKKGRELRAHWLESTLFLNRSDHFEARPLPVEAQFAPAFGLAVGDCDGDGNADLFLSQNFFATQPETSRYDAGRGLWMRGDGSGRLEALDGQQSGVLIQGEQRGCALGDFDADGRLDLAVGQNAGPTKLYQNRGGKPGLRVRLKGSAGNPSAVGATIRVLFGDRGGPAHEIRAGGGYWSQDSSVAVLGTPQPPTRIWVRWPGGKTTTTELPLAAREVEVQPSGAVRVVK